jgi:hypothetical protein
MLEDWSADEVLTAMTTTITAIPTTVPMSAAARTLITATATIPPGSADPCGTVTGVARIYRRKGMTEVPSNVEVGIDA